MPIYEYECRKCKRRTEAIQRVGEKPLKICPHCGGELKKMASAPAIQFKGSGWYVTDYARAKTEEGSASSRKTESTDKTSEKASETPASKPAEKKKEKKGSKE
jgi:putative FmdB family regulatory protein